MENQFLMFLLLLLLCISPGEASAEREKEIASANYQTESVRILSVSKLSETNYLSHNLFISAPTRAGAWELPKCNPSELVNRLGLSIVCRLLFVCSHH